jgi:hypothetical protein
MLAYENCKQPPAGQRLAVSGRGSSDISSDGIVIAHRKHSQVEVRNVMVDAASSHHGLLAAGQCLPSTETQPVIVRGYLA